MSAQAFLLISVLVLTALLIYPVSRLLWVLSVRRLQKRLQRPLDAAEIAAQRRRAWLLGLVLSLIFAVLFNLNALRGLPGLVGYGLGGHG